MAQQSKTALTSRSLTKALGTASILSMAIAGASVANAIETDFGVELKAQGFAIDSEAFGQPSDTDTGWANYLRLKADFKDENTGVSVHTSIELAGSRWKGDNRGTVVSPGATGQYNPSSGGDNTRLDLGYVQVPFANGTILRVGRQASNWNNCFLVCDDRRDRILSIIPTAAGSVLAIYDRRRDMTDFDNSDNGDLFALGLVTEAADFDVGLLYVHWLNNSKTGDTDPYVLSGVHLFSPYISGNLTDNLSLTAGLNFTTSGSITTGNSGQYFNDPALAEYLRLGTSLGGAELNFQVAAAQDGGLISNGFDTYSSLINNNPDSTASPTSLYRMGGTLGIESFNEYLVAGQAILPINSKLSLRGALGMLNVDNGSADDSSMFYDIQAHYQINSAVSTSATFGVLTKNDVARTAGNSLSPESVGNDFADDDLMAASLNMHVKF